MEGGIPLFDEEAHVESKTEVRRSKSLRTSPMRKYCRATLRESSLHDKTYGSQKIHCTVFLSNADNATSYAAHFAHLRGESPRFVLKSPVHTARIPLLLELFPKAKFVYISRHPYDVFASACHMADTTYWYTYLNTPQNAQVQDFILGQYDILWEGYEDGVDLLDDDQLLEVRYSELEKDPVGVVRTIYDGLQLEFSDEHETRIRAEIGDAQYVKNKHPELHEDMKAMLWERWGQSFYRLDYEDV